MIKGTFITKSGTIEISILAGGAQLYQVEVIDVGNIKYDFDVSPDEQEVDSLQVLYNTTKITISQYSYMMGSGAREDLYDVIVNSVYEEGDAEVNFWVGSDAFRFYVTLDDIDLSEIDRTITLNCQVLADPDFSALQVFDEIEEDQFTAIKEYAQNLGDTEKLDCVGVRNWIGYAMRLLFKNESTTTVRSAPTGLPASFSQTNYTSTSGSITDQAIHYIMVRMTDPPFGGIDPDTEWERLDVPVLRYLGSGQPFDIDEKFREAIDLTQELRPGDQVRFYPGSGFPPIWRERIVDEVLSPYQFTVTDPPSGWIGIQLYEVKKKTSTEDIGGYQVLSELAAIEGAIFGYGFSRNFYVNRLAQEDIVEVDWQELESMETKKYTNPINIKVRQLATSVKDISINMPGLNTTLTGMNLGVNNLGIWPAVAPWDAPDKGLPFIVDGKSSLEEKPGVIRDVSLRVAPGYPFMSTAKYDESSQVFYGSYEHQGLRWYQVFDQVLALCRTGLKSYEASLGSDGLSQRIRFTLFGAKTIKPWNLIEFVGDGLPNKYNNKRYRPTSLEYDFVMDKVSVEAYEVEDIDLPVDIPIITLISKSQQTIEIEWTDVGESYDVIVNGELEEEGTTSESHIIEGLTRGTLYGIYIKAYVGSDEVLSELLAVYTNLGSDAPTLTVTATGSTTIELNWDAIGDAPYQIERELSGEPGFGLIHETIDTGYVDTGLDPETEYCYRVRAVLGEEQTDWSNTDCATTDPEP